MGESGGAWFAFRGDGRWKWKCVSNHWLQIPALTRLSALADAHLQGKVSQVSCGDRSIPAEDSVDPTRVLSEYLHVVDNNAFMNFCVRNRAGLVQNESGDLKTATIG